jgi:hypothetical protein
MMLVNKIHVGGKRAWLKLKIGIVIPFFKCRSKELDILKALIHGIMAATAETIRRVLFLTPY